MIYLVSGIKLTGKIRSFDKFAVLLENNTETNAQEQLIYKHAISTVVSYRPGIRREDRALPTALTMEEKSA